MARKFGARHMAWVRSFKKKHNPRRRHRRKRNPYAMGGPFMSLAGNPRRRRYRRNPRHYRRQHHYRRNPGVKAAMLKARGMLGLPPIMPIIYGAGGLVATAGIQGFITPMLPSGWMTNTDGTTNYITKYGILIGSLIAATAIAKMTLGPGPAALAGVGGGIYVMQNAGRDFMPNTIPGMRGPMNLAGYTSVMRPLGSYETNLRAPSWGARNTLTTAGQGGADLVAARYRRFQ